MLRVDRNLMFLVQKLDNSGLSDRLRPLARGVPLLDLPADRHEHRRGDLVGLWSWAFSGGLWSILRRNFFCSIQILQKCA